MCPHCRAFITSDDKTCPYCEGAIGARAIDRRMPSDIMGFIPHARVTTVMILLINTGLYVAMMFRHSATGGPPGMDPDGQTLFEFGAKYSGAIFAGQWWRLVTAGFLHGGMMHILMNSWVLFDLGVQVEEAYGTPRFLVLYFVTTITGFLASAYWSPSLSIGSSAGIFGLIGAMIALGVKDRTSYGAALRSMYVRWAMYGLLMGLIPMFAVDNAAHIGGLAGGFGLAYVAGQPGFNAAIEQLWKVAAGAALALTAVCFALMFRWLMTAH